MSGTRKARASASTARRCPRWTRRFGPGSLLSDEARRAQARAYVHLRPDLDFDTVLRTLRERSARLAPVEPRFHPDVAPLLCRVVDLSSTGERQRRIAELNAYQPPEPEEWLPAESALPSAPPSSTSARANLTSGSSGA